MYSLFHCCAWIVIGSFVLGILIRIPLFSQFHPTSIESPTGRILANTVGPIFWVAMLILFLGMVCVCAFCERSPGSTKFMWFLLFFLLAPIASPLYFFTNYREIVAAHHEAQDA
jgi:hypothetical protein